MKKSCIALREHTADVINFEKKKCCRNVVTSRFNCMLHLQKKIT